MRGLGLACAGALLATSAAAAAPSPDLAPRDEPGGRFVIEGRVLGADGAPLAGVSLYAYHADGKGWYALTRDAPYPRVAGVLRTDARGRYRVRSVLPGMYEGPPHVHFEAWGPDLPASSWFVNLYMGPDEKSDPAWGRMAAVRRLMIDPARPETFVHRDGRGVFHARYDLRWDRAFRMPAHFDSLRRGLIER